MIAGNSVIYYKGSDILNPHLYIPLAITTADKSGIPYTIHINCPQFVFLQNWFIFGNERSGFLMEWIVVQVVILEGVFDFPLNKE